MGLKGLCQRGERSLLKEVCMGEGGVEVRCFTQTHPHLLSELTLKNVNSSEGDANKWKLSAFSP